MAVPMQVTREGREPNRSNCVIPFLTYKPTCLLPASSGLPGESQRPHTTLHGAVGAFLWDLPPTHTLSQIWPRGGCGQVAHPRR